MTTVDKTLILDKLYDVAKDYAFFKTTKEKRRTLMLQRKLNMLRTECNQLGIKYDLSTILK